MLNNMFPVFFHIVERICTPLWRIENKSVTNHNIILIYDGKASFHCNGQTFDAFSGSMVYFKPGDARLGFTYSDNLMKCYAVDFDYIYPIKNSGIWSFKFLSLPFETHEKINNHFLFSRLLTLFNELTSIWISKKDNMEIQLRSVFAEILNLLLKYKSDGQINFDKIRKVEQAISLMVKKLNSKIYLSDIAASIHISPSYLGSIFKEITGKSPIDYYIKMRIDKAKSLLQEGASVSEAASQLGFNDIYYFSKCFKKYTGINPSKIKG